MDEKELRLLLVLATSYCQLLLLEEISKKRKKKEEFGLRNDYRKETL